jgi:hypothetical protein
MSTPFCLVLSLLMTQCLLFLLMLTDWMVQIKSVNM